MKITISKNGNLTLVNISHFKGELDLLEALYLEIVQKVFTEKRIKVITVSPQKYSFGYGFQPFYLMRLNNIDVLVNSFVDFDVSFLKSLVESEEFRRSLILIIDDSKNLNDGELAEIVANYRVGIRDKILAKLVFCEDDGDSLCLFNVKLADDELKSIVDKFML